MTFRRAAGHDYSLSPACFRMLLYVPGVKSSDGWPAIVASGLRRVLELTVATLGGDFPPTIGLDQLDDVANYRHEVILP